MKIGSVDVKFSRIAIAVVAVFTILLIIAVVISGDRNLLIWGIPTLVMLLLIPSALNYMSQQEYAELVPVYRQRAKTVRIKLINENMIGQVVRIEGVVERVHFRFLNRPQYIVADRSGEISVKMFTSSNEDVKVNDVVEVLGQVIRRYFVTGDPVINCVVIQKLDKKSETKKTS